MTHRSWLLTAALVVATASARPRPPGSVQLVMTTTTSSYDGYTALSRSLTANYSATTSAPPGAVAQLTVPESLGLVSPVPFTVQNLQGQTGSGKDPSRHYWGSGTTVSKGQPEWSKYRASGRGDASSGYPNTSQLRYLHPGQTGLTERSRVAGVYKLSINYLGEVEWHLTERQEFLPPLRLSEPSAARRIQTSRPIRVRWQPVPQVLGYTVYAAGYDGQRRPVYWENARGAQADWQSPDPGARRLDRLVSPKQCQVTIPGGIFQGKVTLSVTGYSEAVPCQGVLPGVGWAQTEVSIQLGR